MKVKDSFHRFLCSQIYLGGQSFVYLPASGTSFRVSEDVLLSRSVLDV